MHDRQLAGKLDERPQQTATLQRDRRKAAKLAGQQRQRDAAHVTSQYGPRQEVGDEAQTQRCRDQAHHANGEREGRRDDDLLLVGARWQKLRKAGAEDAQGYRIRADNQLPRRDENCIGEKGQYARVQSDGRRQPGDFRIGHRSRQRHRRDR